jgi:hypothetical protein
MTKQNLEIYLDHRARMAKIDGFNSVYLSTKFFTKAIELSKPRFYAPNDTAYPRFIFEDVQFIRQPPSNISSIK